MVELAFLIGIFSYLIFGLGLLGRLDKLGILGVLGFLGILVLLLVKRGKLLKVFKKLKELKQDKVSVILVFLLLTSVIVNLIGALGPELGFDALWYHLTIPKIYLQNNKIFFIRGGLLYYSAMPKLTEMFYLVSLKLFPMGIMAKFTHFSFGVFCLVALFKTSRKFLKVKPSLIVCLLFYTNLIVGWESSTAYVDLARTFFEILALKLILEWWDDRDWGKKGQKGNIKLYESAAMLGLAISTKLTSFTSLPIFLILILIKSKKLLLAISYSLFAILIVSPWLISSYLWTGNPVFPIFSGILDETHKISDISILKMIKDWWVVFYHSQDLISPVFLIFLPLAFWTVFKKRIKVLYTFSLIVLGFLVMWYLTPRTGGGRFLLPYLPLFSIFIAISVENLGRYYQKFFYLMVLATSVINIGYRIMANIKYIPVVFGNETVNNFLLRNLNFENGDFFDAGGEIKKIVEDDLVLIFGSHNLFYADFSFIHESFAPADVRFSYILTQNVILDEKYGPLPLIYQNEITGVKLYLYGDKVR